MLDNTKHDKIFVLNESKDSTKDIFNFNGILNELGKSSDNNPDQIRLVLEDVLPEYEPKNQSKENHHLNDVKPRAKA